MFSVAVVIPTRNRIERLRDCLSHLVPYVADHPECSITVSDDGDAGETGKALAGDMRIVRVVQGPRRGPAANRNNGAAHSAGELIVFLDDDCIPDPNLLAAYQAAMSSHPETGVFEGRISATGKVTGFADGAPVNETGGYLWSCNFAIRRDVFASIGGFDERFPFAAVEDCDLRLRVSERSAILFRPDARVWHRIENYTGWRVIKHHALSDLLYMHIHGLTVTKKGPVFFLRKAIQTLVYTGTRCLFAGTLKNPEQLVRSIWADLQVAFIVCFWKHHAFLARKFYPSCCAGCESIHATLAISAPSGMHPDEARDIKGSVCGPA